MPSLLSGSVGLVMLVALVLGAVALFTWALLALVIRPRSELSALLAHYGEQPQSPTEDDEPELDDNAGRRLAKAEIVRRAVARAATLGVGQHAVVWIASRLDQANVPLRAAEALGAYAVAAGVAALLALAFVGPIVALGVALGLVTLPLVTLSFLARRRRQRFTDQLPDALGLLSGTLRAGFSLMQGLETLASEVGDPLSEELRRVLSEARLGRQLDDALADMAMRIESPDFEWTVMAIGIQREVGGNLAELLDTVAETMQARTRLRRDVRTLTAEGRISAVVIGVLPIALAGFMWTVNREYISKLTQTSFGQALAVGSIMLAGIGFYWMKKTIEIEI